MAGGIIGAGLAACQDPMGDYPYAALEQRLIDRTERARAGDRPAPVPTDAEQPTAEAKRLDEQSGPRQLSDEPINAGRGLAAAGDEFVDLDLKDAVQLAISHNIEGQIARLQPRIGIERVTEEQAQFDWRVFSTAQYGETQQPQPASALNGVSIGSDATIQENASIEAGLRKRMQWGGTLELSTGLDYLNDASPNLEFAPDPAYTTNLGGRLTQPLLRNAGPINRARIELAENASQREAYGLKQRLLAIAADAEEAYWQLVFQRYQLAIREQLLRETRRTRDELEERRDVDVNPVQMAQAEREVRVRETEVIRARADLRDASDRLKRVLNAPKLPLMGEVVIRPTAFPAEVPEVHELETALRTAVAERPELRIAMLEIDDARIRRRVAANQKLPRLDLTGEVRTFGLDESYSQAESELTGEFVDWLIGLDFEYPLGNRAGEAAVRRTRLAEQAQVLRYRDTAMEIVLSVKQSLRAMQRTFEELRIARQARRAAMKNLRALEERKKLADDLTPEFLIDLRLRTQERLAEAQTREVQAMVSFNIAQARYFQAIGTLLAEHEVDFEPPVALKPLGAGPRRIPGRRPEEAMVERLLADEPEGLPPMRHREPIYRPQQ